MKNKHKITVEVNLNEWTEFKIKTKNNDENASREIRKFIYKYNKEN